MKNNPIKDFRSVVFFRTIKDKLAKKMRGMNLTEKKEFMREVREGKIQVLGK